MSLKIRQKRMGTLLKFRYKRRYNCTRNEEEGLMYEANLLNS